MNITKPIAAVKTRIAEATFEKPKAAAITSTVLGGAFAWVAIWAVNAFAGAGIPAEGAVPITTIFIFLVQRFPRLFQTEG